MVQHTERAPAEVGQSPMELIYTDLAGPIESMARDGFRYAMNFVDSFSGAIFIYFLRHKSDAFKAFEQFLADTNVYGTVCRVRSDCGTEYSSKDFQDVIIKNKIKYEFTNSYSPHQNGKA